MKTSSTAYSTISRISVFTLFIILILFIFESAAWAQLSSLQNGDRVKVLAPDVNAQFYVGTIHDMTDTDLILITGFQNFTIPLSSIEEVQLSRGKKRQTAAGFGFGLLGGVLLGGGMGAATYQECNEEELFDCFLRPTSRIESFFVGAAIGGLGGALLGTIIGRNTYTEQWQDVPVRFSLNFPAHQTKNLSMNPTVSVSIAIGRR